MDRELNELEIRILGCLIEKERTTPENYPLSLKGLTTACNQKTNRNPVMQLDEVTVQKVLDTLRMDGFAGRMIQAGSRVTKFHHDVPEKYKLGDPDTAIICVLMLRGAQTMGELKNHCARLYAFDDLQSVQERLDRLSTREKPLVMELPKLAGQKEARWQHLLAGEIDLEAFEQQANNASGPVQASIVLENERMDTLEMTVLELQEKINHLEAQFAAFKAEFE